MDGGNEVSLVTYNLMGERIDKVQIAIDRLKAFEPQEGYFVAFSGGKDSQCIYHLCEMAHVKFDAHYNVTSVDPPELVRFIKEQYPTVHRNIPRDNDGKPITMWNLIPRKLMPPTPTVRYCCVEMKECNGKGRVTVTGVRWAESANRRKNQGPVMVTSKSKKLKTKLKEAEITFTQTEKGGMILNDDNDTSRRMVEQCYRTYKTMVNPIIDWETGDVWEFLNDIAKVPHCCLYDEGNERLGCIGCPMTRQKGMKRDFNRYPKYKANYMRTFAHMLAERERHGLKTDWKTPQDVMDWWLSKSIKQPDGQLCMFDDGQEVD